jgi:hypothetical protein
MTRETLANQNRTAWRTADEQRARIEAAQNVLKRVIGDGRDYASPEELQEVLRALGCPECNDNGGQVRIPIQGRDYVTGEGPRYKGCECPLCGRMGEDG